MPFEPYLCSFNRSCKSYLGGSLLLGGMTLWHGKNSGINAKSFLLAEALT
jgi:hypothetical protein